MFQIFSQSPLIWYKDDGSVPAIQYFSISKSVIKRILVVNWDNLWNKITRLNASCKWQSVSLHHCKLTSLFMLWLGWTSLYDYLTTPCNKLETPGLQHTSTFMIGSVKLFEFHDLKRLCSKEIILVQLLHKSFWTDS